jgi:dTDP-4-amino-4,6-dideoxygalactose transaminase
MVKFLDVKKITESFQPEIGRVVQRVLESGFYIRGEEVRRFEAAYTSFTGTTHCVGTGNGFDALRLIFRAWLESGAIKEGDEVIVPANTYIASILAVTENRLTPVFVEPQLESFNLSSQRIQEKITSRTRVIMVVHLYGRNAMSPEIKELARKHNLKIVEDNAQAAGCFSGGARTGALGDAGAHSFFPTKNLGAIGDGGAVTTDDADLAETIRTLGHYGSGKKGINELRGVNSRLDELQAAVLAMKLGRLDADNALRRRAARFYMANITNREIVLPKETLAPDEHVWHLFVIRCLRRDALQERLRQAGVEAFVHYPVPPHRQRAYREMNGLSFPITERIHCEALSLPLSPVITDDELVLVVEAVNGFNG